MQSVVSVAQVLYYISLSITGLLALAGYLRAKKREQEEREYRTYDELDNKFLAYQQLALKHDLDLIEVPDASPALAGDQLRLKHELVTASTPPALPPNHFGAINSALHLTLTKERPPSPRVSLKPDAF